MAMRLKLADGSTIDLHGSDIAQVCVAETKLDLGRRKAALGPTKTRNVVVRRLMTGDTLITDKGPREIVEIISQ